MTYQFNNQDEDSLELDQLRTDHNISKILTGLSGKVLLNKQERGAALTRSDCKANLKGGVGFLNQLKSGTYNRKVFKLGEVK